MFLLICNDFFKRTNRNIFSSQTFKVLTFLHDVFKKETNSKFSNLPFLTNQKRFLKVIDAPSDVKIIK